MIDMRPPIFISGSHGGGKSTLIKRLVKADEFFLDNDFDIDFTVDFPNIALLSHFERSLVRLYHRIFIFYYANQLAKKYPQKCVLTNRTVYDSEAYVHVYQALKWINQREFQELDFVLKHFEYRPYAIVLNPPVRVIMQHLQKRKRLGARSARDKLFAKEDTAAFVTRLHDYFRKFQRSGRVLYLEDDSEESMLKIITWARNLNSSNR